MKQLVGLAHVLGVVAMALSLSHLLPLAASLFFDDGMTLVFLFALIFNFTAGFIVWIATRRHAPELKARDGFLLVTLAWTGGAAFATVPLLMSMPMLSFTDAYFETMSALTTTGATVLVNLDTMPQSINLWRHELQWFGGMGIIVLAVAILPLLRVGGMQAYKAEMPGPMKEQRLTPRIADTAKSLWIVYAGLTALCMVSLHLAGMSWFDAICHAFSALALGGFSTHDASVGFYDSIAIEIVLSVFMIVAALNFATHFLAWRRKAFATYLADAEAKTIIAVIATSCVIVAWYLHANETYVSYWTALRHASFNLISIATDSGYASVDFDKWPIFAPMWMLFLSCVLASSGSTGGGIKMYRTLVLFRQPGREMKKLLHPQIIDPFKLGGTVIPNHVVFSIMGFLVIYLMTILVATFALIASGLDMKSAFSGVIACINNMGPGLNQVGPAANYASLSDFQKWVCTLTMFVGRVEVFSVVILLHPWFWKK